MADMAIWFWGGVIAVMGIAGAGVMILAELQEAENDGAADPPAVVVRDTREASAHVGPRLRWESDLALHAVQGDLAKSLLERKHRRDREVRIFRAVKGDTTVETPRTRG